MLRLALPLLATLLLLAYVLRDRWVGERGEPARRDVVLPAAAVERAARAEVDFETVPERDAPARLRGTVLDPYGQPVPKAEVIVLEPQVYEMVFADEEGRYELLFDRPGEYLVEAALTIHLAPARARVLVRDAGDPDPVDFRLGSLGYVFGRVTASGRAVRKGTVDVLSGEDWILDTTCENGVFAFTDEPPEGVPLRLRIRTDEGYATKPVEFVYRGERLDLGTIDFTRHPSVEVRFKRPDGTYADRISAGEASSVRFDDGGGVGYGAAMTVLGSTVFVVADRAVQAALVLEDREGHSVIADFLLVPGEPRKAEVAVRPGPLTMVSRLTDEHGKPIRARFDGGESREDGSFTITLPHGGVHPVPLRALHVEGIGWVELHQKFARPCGFLVDADRPGSLSRLDLDRRILLVADGGDAWVSPRGPALMLTIESNGLDGVLSDPMDPGEYRWTRDNAPPEGVPFQLAERGLTVVDTRR